MCGVNHAVTTWQSPIQVLAGPNAAELAWASQAANHLASASTLYNSDIARNVPYMDTYT